ARARPGRSAWAAWRLPVGMTFVTLLLTVEGLYAIASVVLACGLASWVGPRLGRRAVGLGRLVRPGLPAMALGLVALTGLDYARVAAAGGRALSACAAPEAGASCGPLMVLGAARR